MANYQLIVNNNDYIFNDISLDDFIYEAKAIILKGITQEIAIVKARISTNCKCVDDIKHNSLILMIDNSELESLYQLEDIVEDADNIDILYNMGFYLNEIK